MADDVQVYEFISRCLTAFMAQWMQLKRPKLLPWLVLICVCMYQHCSNVHALLIIYHYINICIKTVPDVVMCIKPQVIKSIQEKSDEELQAIASAGQHFAYYYLSQHSKAMYVRKALQAYNRMFTDMEGLMARIGRAGELSNLTTEKLLELMEGTGQ